MTQRVTMSNQRTIFVRWRQGDKAGEAGGQPRSQDFSFKKMEKPWRRGGGGGVPITHHGKIKWNINYINKHPFIIWSEEIRGRETRKKGKKFVPYLCTF